MKLHYEVTVEPYVSVVIGQRPTLVEAEKLARWHAARRGERYRITECRPKRGLWHYTTLAVVSRDALGRIWTDSQSWEGLI